MLVSVYVENQLETDTMYFINIVKFELWCGYSIIIIIIVVITLILLIFYAERIACINLT